MNTKNMRSLSIVALCAIALSPVCRAQSSIAGDWQGVLDFGGSQYHIVLHLSVAANGALTATSDSIDQGNYGIPVSAITFEGSKLS